MEPDLGKSCSDECPHISEHLHNSTLVLQTLYHLYEQQTRQYPSQPCLQDITLLARNYRKIRAIISHQCTHHSAIIPGVSNSRRHCMKQAIKLLVNLIGLVVRKHYPTFQGETSTVQAPSLVFSLSAEGSPSDNGLGKRRSEMSTHFT